MGYIGCEQHRKELRVMVLKSRNTLVLSAFLFLAVVIMLRLSGGFFEENAVRVIGSIFGASAENVPLLDFSTVNVSWLNPAEWTTDGITQDINTWLHTMIDSVLPAFIYMFNASMIHLAVITRAEWFGLAGVVAKGSALT